MMDESLSLSSFTFLPCKMNVCAMRGFTKIIARLFETYRSMRTYGSVRRGRVKDGGEGCDGREKSGKRRPQSFNNVTALTGPGK